MRRCTLASFIALLAAAYLVSGCAATDPQIGGLPTQRQFASPAEEAYANREFSVYDPIEGTNKELYKFNAEVDRYVLIPVVDAYKYVTPEFLRDRISNGFQNVDEITNLANSLLQLKITEAASTTGRLVVNSTVGLLGTFDVATDWGLKRQPEDFGLTLGNWGAGPGPYLVLPVLGPSNLRDLTGKVVDSVGFSFLVPKDVEDGIPYEAVFYGLQPVNARYATKFRYFESGSPFEYEVVRYAVTTARQEQITGK